MSEKILIVDDELFNLDIMGEYLEDEGFSILQAEDGLIAMDILNKNNDIDLIVLDRMMPNMDGMSVVNAVKKDKKLKKIPIVMQTAAAQKEEVLEGIRAGVYYYLTKPYDKDMFLSIINSALNMAKEHKLMEKESLHGKNTIGLLNSASFKIRTLDEANTLSYFISHCLPDPAQGAYALKELLVNAVEHGNLGISYEEKTKLVLEGKWNEEIINRLELPAYREKYVLIDYILNNNTVEITITDEGKGFDWNKYTSISAERAMDPNGRGIATAKLGNLAIEYKGNGNVVVCRATIN